MSLRFYATWQTTVAANDSVNVPLLGSYVRLLEATGDVRIGFNGEPTQGLLKKGIGVRNKDGEPFKSIRIENTLAAPNTITLGVGLGIIDDNRAIFTSALQLAGSTLSSGADVACATGAKTSVAAANANRRAVLIGALAANTGTVRVGDHANVGAARGQELAPGQSIELETITEVGVRNDTGAAQTVTVLELTN